MVYPRFFIHSSFTFSWFQLPVEMQLFTLGFLGFLSAFVQQMYLHLVFHALTVLFYIEIFICIFLLLLALLVDPFGPPVILTILLNKIMT